VGDVATAVAAVLERDDLAGEIFTIAESTTSAYRLFAEQIIAAADSELELVPVPEERLPEDLKITGSLSQHLLLDASKARRILQWTDRDSRELCADRSAGIWITRRRMPATTSAEMMRRFLLGADRRPQRSRQRIMKLDSPRAGSGLTSTCSTRA
jgi:hypothetical protein